MSTSTKAMPLIQEDVHRRARASWRSNFVSRLIIGFAVIFGVVDAVANRNSMGPDGISYLDIADALRHGHWSALFNPLWSPMYPFLLSIGFRVVHPSPYWEFTTVHFVNFCIYLGVLACFSYFMRVFVVYISKMQHELGVVAPLSAETWAVLGYALFVWSSARLMSVEAVTPDMCVAAFLYLGVALLLRIKTLGGTWVTYSLLGIVLGLGFWAKAPMFPLAFVFLFVSIFVFNGWRQGLKRAALAAVIFFAMASPLIYGLSRAKKRLTFGDSARLNYAFFINQVPRYYWQPSATKAQYPAKQLFAHPAVYLFTVPWQGTYPYWYDPTFWYSSIQPKLNFRGFLRESIVNLQFDMRMFLRLQPAIPLGFLLLVSLSTRRRDILRDLFRQWTLLAIPIAGLVMFSLVHTERRYVAPFVGLTLLAMFTAVCIRNSSRIPGSLAATVVVLALSLMLDMSVTRANAFHQVLDAASKTASPDSSWEVSHALEQQGLQPGDKIAWIRPHVVTTADNYWWARLAKVQIVAEIPNTDNEFWMADQSTRSAALSSLSQSGVKAVVVGDVPSNVSLQNFAPVGSTGYYVRFYQHE